MKWEGHISILNNIKRGDMMEELFEASGMSNLKPIRDIVYENLRKAILEGKLKPNERIVEKEYAEKLNISRTPIREALRKLEIEGLVQYIPRKGVIVNTIDKEEIIETYEIRKALEGLAIRYVVQRITDEEITTLKELMDLMEESNKAEDFEKVLEACKGFNDVILKASRMPKIAGLINTMAEQLERYKRVTMSQSIRRSSAIQEHREIFQAIANRDSTAAERLVIEHLEASQKAFLENL